MSAYRSMRPRLKRILMIMWVTAFVLSGLMLISVYIHQPTPAPNYALEVIDVKDLVREGDDSFKSYKYDRAHDFYQRAESQLATLIQFENDSPSKDITLLQHYYDTKTLLKARIELVSIAEGISRLEQLPPDRLPPTANK